MQETNYLASIRRWLGRLLLLSLVLLLFCAAAGFIYENISEARDRRFNPMPGRLVDVGGRKMHIDCTGEGSPTVILESGLGDSYVSWRQVQPEIAKFARVCSYDRAGLGYSDASSEPRTSKVIAQQLHELLRTAQVNPPYVLVGHSMGGYDVRLYASLYQNEIVGMVLVDSSHPDQENRFPPDLKKMEGRWHREARLFKAIMPFGVPRLFGMCDDDPHIRATDCNFNTAREAVAESNAFPESAAQTASTGPFGYMPLAVLSHDPDKPSSEMPPELARSVNTEWEKMQEEMAHLSTRGTQTIARNSAHYIQNDRPDVVINAVHSIVDQARSNSATNSSNH
jgi:pimeloyl-ACP methyl ester carboxylesterase